MPYFVYIIRTAKNKLYISHSVDIARRELEHRASPHGAKFLRDNPGHFEIIFTEEYATRKDAMRRERQLKRWTRRKKEALISGGIEMLRKL